MDHAKLLDVLTSLPVSQSILPRAVCFATSGPANHAICSFIDSSGYAFGPVRRCLFIDYVIMGFISFFLFLMLIISNMLSFNSSYIFCMIFLVLNIYNGIFLTSDLQSSQHSPHGMIDVSAMNNVLYQVLSRFQASLSVMISGVPLVTI